MRAAKLVQKQATNWVVIKYAQAKAALAKAVRAGRAAGPCKRSKLPKGTREELVVRASAKFSIKGEFRVPLETIQSRIKAERLEVWHTGVTSPIIMVEVTLTAHIIQAWSLNCPLGVTETIALMNSLISGTRYETMMIK